MELLITADLHFGARPEADRQTERLAEVVCSSQADAFAIAGDIGDSKPEAFACCLRLFARFKGEKLLVPGNHDLWTVSADSEMKYRKLLPELASECGFHMLDSGPRVVGDIGFIGNIGWYDYSFRNPALGLSDEDYQKKHLPGVATWNDLRFINWRFSDADFTEFCLRTLSRHYRKVEGLVESVVVILHHVPLRELLYERGKEAVEFTRAYMGSERLGELVLGWEKVRYLFCGHMHTPGTCQTGGMKAFAIGSSYQVKRLLQIQLPSGRLAVREFGQEP